MFSGEFVCLLILTWIKEMPAIFSRGGGLLTIPESNKRHFRRSGLAVFLNFWNEVKYLLDKNNVIYVWQRYDVQKFLNSKGDPHK